MLKMGAVLRLLQKIAINIFNFHALYRIISSWVGAAETLSSHFFGCASSQINFYFSSILYQRFQKFKRNFDTHLTVNLHKPQFSSQKCRKTPRRRNSWRNARHTYATITFSNWLKTPSSVCASTSRRIRCNSSATTSTKSTSSSASAADRLAFLSLFDIKYVLRYFSFV